MEVLFNSVKELVALAESQNKPLSEIMIEQEILITKRSREDIIEQMDNNLKVMEEAVEKGLQGVRSTSGSNRWRCCTNSKIYGNLENHFQVTSY